jgi:hypothetical protein
MCTGSGLELPDERWTLLIMRELVTGGEHFNERRLRSFANTRRLVQDWQRSSTGRARRSQQQNLCC